MFRRFIHTLAIAALMSPAWAGPAYWEATLKEEKRGDVLIGLADISAVALHTYKLNGTIEITECTVDTKGSHSFRFYAMGGQDGSPTKELRTALGSAKELSNDPAAHYPARKFPEGAYSHNVEYQLPSPEAVYKVFKSVRTAWLSSSSTTIKNIDK